MFVRSVTLNSRIVRVAYLYWLTQESSNKKAPTSQFLQNHEGTCVSGGGINDALHGYTALHTRWRASLQGQLWLTVAISRSCQGETLQLPKFI